MEIGIVQYLGKFHPLIVHLPIGILLVAVLFGFLGRKENFHHLQGANDIILFLGAVSATIACVTGFVLLSSGNYNSSTASWHQWMGISLMVISWVAFFASNRSKVFFNAVWVIMLLLLLSTGHLGGSLTHGSDFITPPPVADWFNRPAPVTKPLVLAPETNAYAAVANIVDRKCKSCHGPDKQKGKLRLDSPEFLFTGSKNGKVIMPGEPGESPLIERISLPIDDEDHMPPKEKPQLNEAEVQVLINWIERGAGMDIVIKDLALPADAVTSFSIDNIKHSFAVEYAYVPEDNVEALSVEVLQTLEVFGVQVVPVSANENYVKVSLLHVEDEALPTALSELILAKDQIVWLDLSNKPLDNEGLKVVSQLDRLTKLNLSGCNLSDDALLHLATLKNLQSLNLVNNKITEKGIAHLAGMPELKNLYLYGNMITADEKQLVTELLPSVQTDFGGYTLPRVPADTVVFKF